MTGTIILFPSGNEKLAYMHNPKSGSSLIHESIQTQEELINRTLKIKRHVNPQFFTIVRNPFTRFIDVYESYIKTKSLDPFSHVSGHIRLKDYLDCLLGIIDMHGTLATFDTHLRPQYQNLGNGTIQPNFIGHLEDPESIQDYLSKFGYSMKFQPEKYQDETQRSAMDLGQA